VTVRAKGALPPKIAANVERLALSNLHDRPRIGPLDVHIGHGQTPIPPPFNHRLPAVDHRVDFDVARGIDLPVLVRTGGSGCAATCMGACHSGRGLPAALHIAFPGLRQDLQTFLPNLTYTTHALPDTRCFLFASCRFSA